MNIGIIGNGFVGKATQLLKCKKINIFIYDIIPELCYPIGLSIKDICEKCDLIFISVPTPMNIDHSCHTDILENVILDIKKYVNLDEKCIVIRSTVPPGTSDSLNCYFMPEFLTEKNYKKDFINNKNWIFGLKDTKQDIQFKFKINFLINESFNSNRIFYNNITYMKNKEAEMVKLFRNTFLAVKVSYCNEIYDFCNTKNIDYENVRKVACLDERIGESHSFVPGPDGKKGYGGVCFPKDIRSLKYEFNKANIKSYIIDSSIKRNEFEDRKEKDWEKNKGRTII